MVVVNYNEISHSERKLLVYWIKSFLCVFNSEKYFGFGYLCARIGVHPWMHIGRDIFDFPWGNLICFCRIVNNKISNHQTNRSFYSFGSKMEIITGLTFFFVHTRDLKISSSSTWWKNFLNFQCYKVSQIPTLFYSHLYQGELLHKKFMRKLSK